MKRKKGDLSENILKPSHEDAATSNPTVNVDVSTIRMDTGGRSVSVSSGEGEASVAPEDVLERERGKKYRLGSELAKGGMGEVYEARDVNCRRSVAMKVLKGLSEQEGDMLRFIEEAQITSQLEHPNIVPVHELGVNSDGRVFYTMKLVKGMTLSEILESIRAGRESILEHYPLSRLLTIYQKACDAVAYAHSKGVIHRDLKPDNIMIGDYGEVWVMDWGLAKVVCADQENEEVFHDFGDGAGGIDSIRFDEEGWELKTFSGRIMGTPAFMSPEQASSAPVEIRSDIYSLGAILYSVLTLRPPVTGESLDAILKKIKRGQVVPPVESVMPMSTPVTSPSRYTVPHCPGSQIPPALSEVVVKAMATNLNDRYQSVKELQQDVEAYQDGLIWNLMLDEDFSDSDIWSRWQVFGGECEVIEDGLRLFGGEPQFLLFKKPLGGSVRIEFECVQEGEYLNDIACFMSAVRSENWRDIPTSGYECAFGRFCNSANLLTRHAKHIWSASASPIQRGEKYVVRAERVGARLRLVVNGEEIFRVVDDDPLSGSERTLIGVLGGMADTKYTRIRLYSLGTPWRADILETAERHLQKGHYVTAMDLFQEVIDSFPDAERLSRARQGYEKAFEWNGMVESIPVWKRRLEKVWPGVTPNIHIDNDGLSVDISNAGICTLEPLKGMPIRSLNCSYNAIDDLSPLMGMQLVTLNCCGNRIHSLESLRGMPLKILFCEGCPVETLEPLRGMSLNMLNCGGSHLENGLDPLRDSSTLSWLSCWRSGITSLEPLKGLPLTTLYCDGNAISDITPLVGMPLGKLICGGNKLCDLNPLRRLPLTILHCGQNQIETLEALRGLSLTVLTCQGNNIKSLEPLRDMPLGTLICGANPIQTLDPFIENPPYRFHYDCDSLSVDELRRARDRWAQQSRHAHHVKNMDVLLLLREQRYDELKQFSAPFGDHLYLHIPKLVTWHEAKQFCETLGGNLLTLKTANENRFVTALLPEGSWFWLGLEKTEDGHRWIDGEKAVFTAFSDPLREQISTDKVFSGGIWSAELYNGAHNCFMIKWEVLET